MKKTRNNMRMHRTRRVRAKISGTAQRPRLHVFRSLTSLSVQIIDDVAQSTLVAASLKEISNAKNNVDGAQQLGTLIAKKAKGKGIETVVFDRSGYKYHGKIKAIAESARKAGLVF